MNTTTKYLGLDLKSPIIAGSCGLTENFDNLVKLEECGAGAVVLKSIFEEQIIYDIKRNTHVVAPTDNYGESYDYIAQHVEADALNQYFELIRKAKQKLTIPVVASINCFSYENWLTYAKFFEEAGCDAMELNMSLLPCETTLGYDDVDRMFSDTINTLRKSISVPISIKVGYYFTDMAKFMQQLSWMGIQGVTLFNKNVQMDIDVENESFVHTTPLTAPDELYHTLRWVSVLTNKMRCGISASTGVNSPKDVVKMLLAGATTVQVVSTLYRNGIDYMRTLNQGLQDWMARKGYEQLSDFMGKMSVKQGETASEILRTQFMKYYAEI